MRHALPLVLSLLTACAGGGADKPKEIVIGEYGSLTGTSATFGMSTHNGVELATKEQKAIGGINIRIVVEDDRSLAEEAATAVNKILSQDRPVAVIGEVSSSRSLAAAPLLQAAGVPMISPSSTSVKVTQVGDFIFRVCFIDPFQGDAIANFAWNNKSVKTAAILKDVKNDYSVGLADVFTKSFTGLGGQVVGEEAYSEGDNDFKAQLTNLIAKSPDALILTGYYTEVGLIAKQARDLGFKGIFIGGDGWDSDKLVPTGGESIIGAFYTNHYSVDDPTPAVQEFIKKYEAAYKAKPDGLAALGYDAAKILYQAMDEVAKNPEHLAAFGDRSGLPATEDKRKAARKALRDRLARVTDYPGVTGKITIDKDRNAQKPAVVVEVTKDGPKFVAKIEPGGMAPGPEGAALAIPAGGPVPTPSAPAAPQ